MRLAGGICKGNTYTYRSCKYQLRHPIDRLHDPTENILFHDFVPGDCPEEAPHPFKSRDVALR